MSESKNLIYLDHAATTPVDPRVVEAMIPYFTEKPGNAASRHHAFGWVAEEAVEYAREEIAALIAADPREIVFTSGATESDNLAIKGVFEKYHRKGCHVITVKTEHNAVLDACRGLERKGGEVTYLEVGADGLIDLNTLRDAIRPDTVLVSVMWANNETGVIQPMREIGDICAEKGVLLMSDATQAVGKIPVNPREAGVHLMAFTAHKLYGPKGAGALYVSRRQPRVKISQQIEGGGHEQGMRSGTLNVPGIVAFGKAAVIAREEMTLEGQRLARLRDELENTLLQRLEESYVNGHRISRLPHISNMSFKFVDGENLMMEVNQTIAVSSGSACTSASLEPSHVLRAMGMTDDMAHAAIRFSLGRFTTRNDIDRAVEAVIQGVNHLRELSPIWEMYKDGVDLDSVL
jgi:cysteine desulfurase